MSNSMREMIKESVTQRLNDLGIEINEQLAEFINYGRLDSAIDSALEKMAQEQKYSFKDGDVYWVVDGYGEPDFEQWNDHFYDKKALENNEIFKTQEEAEFEAERLKVLRELEKLGRAYEKDNFNFMIYINGKNNITTSEVMFNGFYGNYYFDSEEEAEKAIEKIGAKRIKKYLFGIEE